MNVSINQELITFVKECVKRGEYKSASAVIREGLTLLREVLQERAKRNLDQTALLHEFEQEVNRRLLGADYLIDDVTISAVGSRKRRKRRVEPRNKSV